MSAPGGADITIRPLCPAERFGHAVAAISIDPRRKGRKYRFIYAECVVGPRPCNAYTGTCRVDVRDGSVVTFHGACPPTPLPQVPPPPTPFCLRPYPPDPALPPPEFSPQ